MKFLTFDFETTGVGKDKKNGYKNYDIEKMPLPRTNYPVELAISLADEDGNTIKQEHMVICGARRLDPWVQENCPHLSIKNCERDGISFEEMLNKVANIIGEEECTLVAHNIQYDWDEVLLYTAKEQELTSTSAFLTLKKCPQYCTMINPRNKKKKTAYFYHKLHKWIGPSLGSLAKELKVSYDESKAHSSIYDTDITQKCFFKMRD